MKTCFSCSKEKSLDQFYRHPQMADGRLNKCIECAKRDALNHRQKNLEKVRDYDRRRGDSASRVKARKAYQATEKGREAMARGKAAWAERNKHKVKAVWAVNNALRDGRLYKAFACARCGLPGELEGHHSDYGKPLDVTWLHDHCHKSVHKEERAARRRNSWRH